jgi:hypothetical protein
MADQNFNDDERRRRDMQNEGDWDWDWEYYEYRWVPYSGTDFTDRNQYGRNFDRNQYGRNMSNRDYDRNYYDRGNYGRNDFNRSSMMNRSSSSNYGRYSGYGPRDYRRSDDRIEEDVNDRLTWHSQLDATDLKVDVNNGIVTLTGTVDNRQDKRLAEDVAESVPGVWDVNNQIVVRNRGYYRGWRGGNNMSNQIQEGVEVVDRDGQRVGTVKEVRTNDFLVDRSMARDIFIPFSACTFTNGRVQLNVRSDELEQQGWQMPEMTESQRNQKNR